MTGRAWGVILLLSLAIVAGTGIWLRCEGSAPAVRGPDAVVLGRAARTVQIDASDPRSGVRRLSVAVRHAEGESVVFEEEYPGNLVTGGLIKPDVPTIEVPLDAKALSLRDGEGFLVVEATDWSWTNLLGGNRTVLEIPFSVDLKPPRVSVESGLTYLRRGGSASVVYRVGDDAIRHGVEAGDRFYRGFPMPGDEASGRHVAIFAIARNAPENPKILVVAEDAAGNRSSRSWATRPRERRFKDETIRLGPSFLSGKVAELSDALADRFDLPDDPVAAFQIINRDVRAKNEEEIRTIVARSGPERLFSGGFLQMRNSKVTSEFAEARTYWVDGEKVSEAIHYGFDLASTSGAPIEAANRGRVLFADSLGIYGNCVILDHGLGVTSLYAHLSRIDVGVDDVLKKGQTLGTSGATGLAGGDHLHFAILVGDTYVDPTEWWDAKWVRDHVETKLAPTTPDESQE